MVVAVVGCRNSGALTVERVMAEIPPECTGIISGGAIGVDTLAKQAATRLGLPFAEYKPDYELFGKLAPLCRNTTIVERADLVIAFWDGHSRGTLDTIQKAWKLEKPVRVISLE